MKVLVCGSRKYRNAQAIADRLALLPKDCTVLHGCAMGADSIAAREAERLGLGVEGFPIDWANDGERAPLARNLRMLDEKPSLVIAFWDYQSSGTMHTVSNANKRGIDVEIIDVDGSRVFGSRAAAQRHSQFALTPSRGRT